MTITAVGCDGLLSLLINYSATLLPATTQALQINLFLQQAGKINEEM